MIKNLPYLVVALVISCGQNPQPESNESLVTVKGVKQYSSRIAFGSCNNAYAPNELWDDVLLAKPEAWIWGGDIVYADSDDFETIEKHYRRQLENVEYSQLAESSKILATWDDHDYGTKVRIWCSTCCTVSPIHRCVPSIGCWICVVH